MLLYCRDDLVIATHDDVQAVPASLYGAGCVVIPAPAAWSGSVGDPAPELTTADDLKRYAANKRWLVEVGGIKVGAITVPTDDRAKLLILGAAGAGSSAPFIAGGVNYGMVTAAQFQAINAAIIAHTQATWPVLASVLADIDSGEITTVEEIDAAAWPPNT